MKSQADIPPKMTWQQKVVVTLLIPCLYLYYTVVQPARKFFKELISEQGSGLRHKERPVQKPEYRETFIKNAALVFAIALINFSIRYRWLIAFFIVSALMLSIGALTTIECVAVWCFLWIGYSTLNSLGKGINQSL